MTRSNGSSGSVTDTTEHTTTLAHAHSLWRDASAEDWATHALRMASAEQIDDPWLCLKVAQVKALVELREALEECWEEGPGAT